MQGNITAITTVAPTPYLVLNGVFESTRISVVSCDQKIAEAIRRFPDPSLGIESLLSVGATAALATTTSRDFDAVRQALDHALDGANGAVAELTDRIHSVVGDDGPIAVTLAKASGDLTKTLNDALASHGDSANPASLVSKVQGGLTKFEQAMEAARKQVGEELRAMSERNTEQLQKAVREVRDLDPTSGLGVAISRIEQRLNDLGNAVAAEQARAQERRNGTLKGGDYEQTVLGIVSEIAASPDERVEHTANQEGRLRQKARGAKRGDITTYICGSPAVVLECMNRGGTPQTASAVMSELREAMDNRDAPVGIAVMSAVANGVMNGRQCLMLGPNMLACVVDPEVPDDLALRAAYFVARHLFAAQRGGVEIVDTDRMAEAVERLDEQIGQLGALRTHLANSGKSVVQALEVLTRFEQRVREEIAVLRALVGETTADQAAA